MASTAGGDADPGAASAPLAAPAAPIEGQEYTDQNNVPSLFEVSGLSSQDGVSTPWEVFGQTRT